ncbi:MAG: class I SAM-dependent methyltransferase [Desulfobacterota bacterium]|nr:class I SAM-dependent methyltransferase [Thermodesulfobacteriota bacterium]
MSVDWERRYKEGFYSRDLKTHWVLERYHSLIKSGPVLEIAMGIGRDLIFLSERGYRAIGMDISMEALRQAKERFNKKGMKDFFLVRADAQNLPFKEGKFGCVLVFYFLIRGIVKELKNLLKKDGLLVYETYLKRQNLIEGFRNPDYLLEDGELLHLFEDFECIFYEEGIFETNGKRRALARFVGRKK